MVMMNQSTDFMEMLFSDDFLTMNGEIIPPMSEVSDQRLDLSEYTRSDEQAGITFSMNGELLSPMTEGSDQRLDPNEYTHTDEQYVTFIPDMDTLLENDETCPKASEEVVIEILPESAITTSLLEQNQGLVFQFPSTSQTGHLGTVDEGFLADFTDDESTYSSTVPSTPFSPDSPFSPPPPTPDTASSSDSGYGRYRRSVKDDLKNKIKIKRLQQGKGDLKVEFATPEPERLTEEEQARRDEKREKNKMAAQKCREKKRQKAEVLEAEIKVLAKKQTGYELDIQKLIEERDHLRDIIAVHGTVCPDFRAATANI